jgi:hypothetical protein
MICIDFGDFPINPLLFGFNCIWQYFFAFLTFQELRDSEKGKVKEHGLQILRQTFSVKVGYKGTTWPKIRPGGAVNKVDRATWARLGLGGRFRLSFDVRHYMYVKKPYF